ncbi:MAG: maleylpyruvate isomerase family mycothiol-dependent enzyme [Nocardioidaceae bacterium]
MHRSILLASVRSDLALIEAALGDLTSPVPACPGWDLGRLARHLLGVHRMATYAVTTGAPPPSGERPRWPGDADGLRTALTTSGEALVSLLQQTDPDRPAWSFLGTQPGAFWTRRMAHEHAIHRVDAQQAAGLAVDPVAPEQAADGIEEWLLIANERTLPRRDTPLDLGGGIHLRATDTDRAWTIRSEAGRLVATRGRSDSDASLRGTASDLLLGLWARTPLGAGTVERVGDDAVIAALADIGGN